MSDSLEHSTTTVHTFQEELFKHINSTYQQIRKIHYFTDGCCAGQYKNRYNFTNLCHHKEDFQTEAEWNFLPQVMGRVLVIGLDEP